METPLRTELDPEVREALEALNRTASPPQIPIERFREEKQARFRNRGHDPPAVAGVEDFLVPGGDVDVPVRAYYPGDGGPYPVLLWFHGGGWCHGSMDMTDTTARWLVDEVGCVVVPVEYRLSPEHAFPAALRDAVAAVEWVAAHPELVRGDPERVAVGGTSAGANLAAAVSLLARDADGPPIALQLLAVPVTDVSSFDTDSYRENGEGYGLTEAAMRYYARAYARDEFDAHHPYVSPLQARDLADLPRAVVLTAGFDPLRDEGIAYAERLSEAGVPVEHVHHPDVSHYVRQHRNQGLAKGVAAFEDLARGLREGLGVAP